MFYDSLEEAIELWQSIRKDQAVIPSIMRAAALMNQCFKRRGQLLIAGNGGSAAEAQHFAAEIVGRYERERKGYPAVALTTDTSILTALGNDYGFDRIFSRQVEALGRPGDIFICLSTSGQSRNLMEAAKKAKELKLSTIGLLGKGGGELKDLVDVGIVVPSAEVPRIQEIHLFLIHWLCAEAEKNFH